MSLGKSVVGGQNSQCKGPEAQAGLTCSRNSEEASVAGVGEQGGMGQGARKGKRTTLHRALLVIVRTLVFILAETGAM